MAGGRGSIGAALRPGSAGESGAPAIVALGAEQLAGYVTGVIATLVAIGGLYLAKQVRATTPMAVIAAGAVSIWLGRSSFRVVRADGGAPGGSCVPEGMAELGRSVPVVLAAILPVLALAGAAASLWSVTVGLHIAQAVGVMGLVAAGLLTARRVQAAGWALVSYVAWPTTAGLLVVGIELLSRTV